MIDLTYTIAHIQIGATNYYEEVSGFISDDKDILINSANLGGIMYDNDQLIEFHRRESHPLFEVANKLGAIIYSRYKRNEEDFYIAMPTAYNIKAGDIFFRPTQKWIAVYDIEFGIGIRVEDENCYKPRNLLHILNKYNDGNLFFGDELRKAEEDLKNNYDKLFKECLLDSIKDNIFKEYARTGIVKSDIYKQHFKEKLKQYKNDKETLVVNDRVKQAINKIEESSNETRLDFSNLGLTTEDLAYLFNIEKYEGFFESLKKLYLHFNKLSNLPENIFENLIKLEWLDLQNNNLSTLPEKIFDNLVKLKWLDLSYNNIEDLPENIFENLIKLELLGLQNNNLSTLPEKILDNLVNLEDLGLLGNKLSSLPEKILDNLVNLEWLSLSRNNLTNLPENIFEKLINLEDLYLSNNNLSTLPEKIKNKKGLQIYYY